MGSALGLDAEEAALVVRAAEEAIARGASFATTLQPPRRRLLARAEAELVEALWRIAFADAELAGQEEYLVRKIAGQLHLTTADLVETQGPGPPGLSRRRAVRVNRGASKEAS